MTDLLKKWDQSLGQVQLDRLQTNLDRRRFLHDSCKATVGISLLPSLTLFSGCDQTPQITQAQIINNEPWASFAATQAILFPADGNGPGAHDLNATAYLKFVLEAADTDQDDKQFILNGVDWLNQLSTKQTKNLFKDNDSKQQQALITQIAKSQSGERWLAFLLLYIFEALLTDPVYGANPEGIGWHWLEHKPGFPHPPQDKIYTELLKR